MKSEQQFDVVGTPLVQATLTSTARSVTYLSILKDAPGPASLGPAILQAASPARNLGFQSWKWLPGRPGGGFQSKNRQIPGREATFNVKSTFPLRPGATFNVKSAQTLGPGGTFNPVISAFFGRTVGFTMICPNQPQKGVKSCRIASSRTRRRP